MDVEAIGRAAMLLGAGRARSSDTIDPGVGLQMMVSLGDTLKVGQPIARVAYNDESKLQPAQAALLGALELGEASAPPPLVHARLTSSKGENK